MKNLKLSLFVLSASLFAAHAAIAQAPAGAPAGATGLCNDGSYTTKTLKFTACTGHKGVKAWYVAKTATSTKTTTTTAAPAPAAAPAAKPTTTTAAAPAAAKTTTKSASNKTVAPGGGPGLVWLNTSSKVYHCYGGADYGTTKAGKYMSESAAKQAGGHAAGGKTCGGM